MPIRVTIWNEYIHERKKPEVAELYPDGIHAFLRDVLQSEDVAVTTATLDEPEQGLPDAVLNNTDVLIWWGHIGHKLVSDELVEELYSEPFFVPKPDDLIFCTWYEDGNLFRGGMTYTRGLGKIFYFHPGHEICNSYYDKNVRQVLKNAVLWCAPALCEGFDNSKCHKQTESLV